jgi:hypothetical protein
LKFPELPDLSGNPPLLAQIHPAVTNQKEIPSYSKHPSLLFVGQTEIYVAQPGGEWSTVSLGELLGTQSFSITKDFLQNEASQIRESAQQGTRLLPFIFPLFFFFISFPLRVLNVFLDTIVIYLCVKILGFPLNFKKTFQLSLHICVAAELATILTANFAKGLPMFSIAFWAYVVVVFWNLRHIQALPIDALVDREKDQS